MCSRHVNTSLWRDFLPWSKMYNRRQQTSIHLFLGKAWMHTQNAGRQIESFVRHNGNNIRTLSMQIAPLLAPENPALAAGIATLGRGATSYSSLRDSLDRAAGV